jgi:hypothetical protein
MAVDVSGNGRSSNESDSTESGTDRIVCAKFVSKSCRRLSSGLWRSFVEFVEERKQKKSANKSTTDWIDRVYRAMKTAADARIATADPKRRRSLDAIDQANKQRKTYEQQTITNLVGIYFVFILFLIFRPLLKYTQLARNKARKARLALAEAILMAANGISYHQTDSESLRLLLHEAGVSAASDYPNRRNVASAIDVGRSASRVGVLAHVRRMDRAWPLRTSQFCIHGLTIHLR